MPRFKTPPYRITIMPHYYFSIITPSLFTAHAHFTVIPSPACTNDTSPRRHYFHYYFTTWPDSLPRYHRYCHAIIATPRYRYASLFHAHTPFETILLLPATTCHATPLFDIADAILYDEILMPPRHDLPRRAAIPRHMILYIAYWRPCFTILLIIAWLLLLLSPIIAFMLPLLFRHYSLFITPAWYTCFWLYHYSSHYHTFLLCRRPTISLFSFFIITITIINATSSRRRRFITTSRKSDALYAHAAMTPLAWFCLLYYRRAPMFADITLRTEYFHITIIDPLLYTITPHYFIITNYFHHAHCHYYAIRSPCLRYFPLSFCCLSLFFAISIADIDYAISRLFISDAYAGDDAIPIPAHHAIITPLSPCPRAEVYATFHQPRHILYQRHYYYILFFATIFYFDDATISPKTLCRHDSHATIFAILRRAPYRDATRNILFDDGFARYFDYLPSATRRRRDALFTRWRLFINTILSTVSCWCHHFIIERLHYAHAHYSFTMSTMPVIFTPLPICRCHHYCHYARPYSDDYYYFPSLSLFFASLLLLRPATISLFIIFQLFMPRH